MTVDDANTVELSIKLSAIETNGSYTLMTRYDYIRLVQMYVGGGRVQHIVNI